jgi:hypothetical protein
MITAAIEHVDRLVGDRLDALAKQAIANFKTIRTDSKASGDDSPLENVWEEFKDQVQNDESFYWDAYEETFLGICGAYVQELSTFEFRLLWYWTQGYVDWHEDREEEPPYYRGDLANEIFERIKVIAAYEPLTHEAEGSVGDVREQDENEVLPTADCNPDVVQAQLDLS